MQKVQRSYYNTGKIRSDERRFPMTRTKKQRNTADLLVECLEEEGVHYIFGIPGEENLSIMNALERSKIEFITVRHEQGRSLLWPTSTAA